MTAVPHLFPHAEPLARAVAERAPDTAGHPLAVALSAAVPLWALRFDPLDDAEVLDRAACQRLLDRIQNAGEAILYRVKTPGVTADAFNALAEAIARMARLPGGVRAFGMRFEYRQSQWSAAKHGVPEP